MTEPDYVAINREGWTRANAEYTDARASKAWQDEVSWGKWSLPETEVRALPDVTGKEIVELGCGTGYFGAWLKRAGAKRVVGVDVTPAQLETARRVNEELGLGLEFLLENAEHAEKPFFGELVEFITSAPTLALALEGEGAIATVRRTMGATNPADSEPGSIRGDLALSMPDNLVHGSDSPESAQRELELWFGD